MRLARAILALYPRAWRARYGDEIQALMDEDPPGARALLDLLVGALRAHARDAVPAGVSIAARERVGDTITCVLGCFICFAFVVVTFAKTLEDPRFSIAGHSHPLLAVTRGLVSWGTLAAALLLEFAAAPLALLALRAAWRERRLRRLTVAPALALGGFAAATGLFALYSASVQGRPGPFAWAIFGVWCALAVCAAAVCWAAPRALLTRLAIPLPVLRFSLAACVGVVICMVAVVCAGALYLGVLLLSHPELGALPNGPGGVLPTNLSLGLALVVMAVLGALATVSARRGTRAAR